MFGQDTTLPTNHVEDWKYKHQRNQAQLEKYVIHKNCTRINHDYRVVDQVMIDNKTSFKFETPFKGPYELFQT